MSGMLVIHRDRKGAGDHQGTQYPRENHPPSGTPHFLPLLLRRISLRCVSGLAEPQRQDPRNPYVVFRAPQWTLSFRKVRVVLRSSFLGLQTQAKGAEVSTDHLKLFLSRRRWQVSVSALSTLISFHIPAPMVIPTSHSYLICLPVPILLSPRAEKGPGSHCVPLAFLV